MSDLDQTLWFLHPDPRNWRNPAPTEFVLAVEGERDGWTLVETLEADAAFDVPLRRRCCSRASERRPATERSISADVIEVEGLVKLL